MSNNISPNRNELLDAYMAYVAETESPYIYHRWCALASIGALLGRSYHSQFGHRRIFPNIYCLLIGEAGTRKSSAIHIIRDLVADTGYDTFAADKTSKEKFLLDLEGATPEDLTPGSTQRKPDAATLENLWGSETINLTEPKEVYIVADEFSEFSKLGDSEFYTTLGNLWDWDAEGRAFTNRLKNSHSVSVYQPTVSLLGGTTPVKFARIFPVEIMDDGFLSRMIFIRGERSGRKYEEPPIPDQVVKATLTEQLGRVRSTFFTKGGAADLDERARGLLRDIYHGWVELDDNRFRSYSTRRYTQLRKICLIVAACRLDRTITAEVVIEANTYLSAAEAGMPKALGEFGKSRNSDVTNKIMDIILATTKPLSLKDLWMQVSKDLDKINMLADILNGLEIAGKIQRPKGVGILPVRSAVRTVQWVDWDYLTEEERSWVL